VFVAISQLNMSAILGTGYHIIAWVLSAVNEFRTMKNKSC